MIQTIAGGFLVGALHLVLLGVLQNATMKLPCSLSLALVVGQLHPIEKNNLEPMNQEFHHAIWHPWRPAAWPNP